MSGCRACGQRCAIASGQCFSSGPFAAAQRRIFRRLVTAAGRGRRPSAGPTATPGNQRLCGAARGECPASEACNSAIEPAWRPSRAEREREVEPGARAVVADPRSIEVAMIARIAAGGQGSEVRVWPRLRPTFDALAHYENVSASGALLALLFSCFLAV